MRRLNRFQPEIISLILVVLNECEGPHCRTLHNFLVTQSLSHLITCQKKRFFASAQNDEKTFILSGVYAPLHPAPAFQINDFSYCLRRVFQTGCAAWLAAINGSTELTSVNPFALCRQSALPPKVPQNRYSALRSHINCKAQLERVNSVLRTSDNTRLVVVSLTLMAHSVKSTKSRIFCQPEFISSIHVTIFVIELRNVYKNDEKTFILPKKNHGNTISIHSFISKRVNRILIHSFPPESHLTLHYSERQVS